MATFTGDSANNVANALTGILDGFTGGTLAELQDAIGDRIRGLGGNDTIVAGPGDDVIEGGEGSDTIFGGVGDDFIYSNVEAGAVSADGDILYGEAGDDTANDGIFTATLPAHLANPGEMIRWRIVTQDTDHRVARAPAFLDTAGENQSPEYFGTVVSDPNVESPLNVPRKVWM